MKLCLCCLAAVATGFLSPVGNVKERPLVFSSNEKKDLFSDDDDDHTTGTTALSVNKPDSSSSSSLGTDWKKPVLSGVTPVTVPDSGGGVPDTTTTTPTTPTPTRRPLMITPTTTPTTPTTTTTTTTAGRKTRTTRRRNGTSSTLRPFFSSRNQTTAEEPVKVDGKLAYQFFYRPIAVILEKFEERMLYVSARRRIATVKDIDFDCDALNVLFNPLAQEATPYRLTSVLCKRVSVDWRSWRSLLFTMDRDPLEVRLPSVEFTFDGAVPDVPEPTRTRIHKEWLAAIGEAKPPTSYPPVEGANFEADRLVCVFNRVETPLPGFRNATVKIGLRDVRAVSVDKNGDPTNLRTCWTSFNGDFRKSPSDFIIAKRLVGQDLQITIAKTPGTEEEEEDHRIQDDDDLLDDKRRENDDSDSSPFSFSFPAAAQQQQAPEKRVVNFPQASFTAEEENDGQQRNTKNSATTSFIPPPPATTRKPPQTPPPQRIIVAPRAAALLTFGYEDLQCKSIRCDAWFETLDVDLPELAFQSQRNNSDNSIAFRVGVGRYGDAPDTPDGIDWGGRQGDYLAGRRQRLAEQKSNVSTVNFLLRSALSVFLFLWSLRLVF